MWTYVKLCDRVVDIAILEGCCEEIRYSGLGVLRRAELVICCHHDRIYERILTRISESKAK